MAGGKGERLHPLTRDRSKPSVPFGGRYRIVDFVLSNFVNSEMAALYVLVQYKSQSLIEHLRQAWRTSGILPDYFITVVPPQMRFGPAWYRGTADAVLQNLNVVDDFNPDVVAIFGADHIYRMDINQMLAFHEESGADVTVAARPVPRAEATQFGILEIDGTGRVVAFEEKPARPKGMPNDPEHSLVSMGNYLFSRQALTDALLADARRSTDHDFGRSIIPELVPTGRVYAYDFQSNEVPGVKPYEEQGYWRDVGTVQAYWDAHMDLLGESPRFDLDNRWWPIRTGQHPGPAARFIGGEVDNAHVGEASLIKRATIRNSILGRSVWVNEGAVIEDSIVMDHTTVGKGARAQARDRRSLQHHPGRQRDRRGPRPRPAAALRRSLGHRRGSAGRAPRVPARAGGVLGAGGWRSSRAIVIHGHFYQPPRENPWLEAVEVQDSAAPYHDWNERITAECYAPNTAARRVDDATASSTSSTTSSASPSTSAPRCSRGSSGRRPAVARAIVDGRPRQRGGPGGHGNAIAQVYNHLIMPLATRPTRSRRCAGAWPTSGVASAASPRGCGCPRPPSTTRRWRCWPRRA